MLTSWWSRSFVNPKPYKLNKPLALIKRKGSTLGLESHGVRSLGVRKFMVEGARDLELLFLKNGGILRMRFALRKSYSQSQSLRHL